MKILLIQPQSSIDFIDQVFMHEPLGLEYLGAGLKRDGHEVLLLDARLETDYLVKSVAFQPDIIGLTGYTSQVTILKNLALALKRRMPGVLLVVGGHHATVRPVDFQDPAIDLIVIGEGVSTLREIAKNVQDNTAFETIDGLAIPGKTLRFTKPRQHCALDTLPLPDRSLTASYRKHYFSEWLQPLASVRTSLGCVGRCTFCALWALTGGRYLTRSPEQVVEEIASIAEENIFFCDDESMCDVQRMAHLAELLLARGVKKKYFLYARVDTIIRHRHLFVQWRDIGLQQVFVGMESFSNSRLQALNKGITLEQQQQAAAILKELGILMYASFVVHADFSHDDFRKLTAYIRHLQLQQASFSILTPLPGTVLYEQCEGQLYPYQPELFDFLHTVVPPRLPLPEFYQEFARLYQQAIPPYRALQTLSLYGLRRIPRVLRLLHRATTTMRKAHLTHNNQ